jgi:hypothetical protein
LHLVGSKNCQSRRLDVDCRRSPHPWTKLAWSQEKCMQDGLLWCGDFPVQEGVRKESTQSTRKIKPLSWWNLHVLPRFVSWSI